MATYKLDLESPAVEFIEHLIRKKNHVSLFYAAVDLRFQVEPKESGKRKVTMNILGNLISGTYKTAKATFTIGKDKTTNCLAYTFEFEQIDANIVDECLLTHLRLSDARYNIINALFTYIRLSDFSYNRKVKHNSIDAGYPADECFNYFYNAYEVDDKVKMGGVDWQKKTFTISFIRASSSSMKCNFKTIKVTITIIPKNEGSRVKWTIEVEKIDEDTEEPDSFVFLARSIRETIQSKLRK